jgi:hypothetical protein
MIGLNKAGFPGIVAIGLRLDELGEAANQDLLEAETTGTMQRASKGKFTEEIPVPNDSLRE